MNYLENVQIAGEDREKPFRMPVQWVNRPHLDFRGFCGTVASGVIRPGDELLVASSGRTVFFVSHNTQAVRQLCTRCILLEHGQVAADGPTDATLAIYNQRLRDTRIDAETGLNNPENRRGSGAVRFTAVSVEDVTGAERYSFQMGENIRFKLSFKVHAPMRGAAIVVALRSGMSREMVTSARHVGSNIPASYVRCLGFAAMPIPTYRAVITTQPPSRINPAAPQVPSPESHGGE